MRLTMILAFITTSVLAQNGNRSNVLNASLGLNVWHIDAICSCTTDREPEEKERQLKLAGQMPNGK